MNLLVLQIGRFVVTSGNVEVHLRAEVVLAGVPLLVGEGLVVGSEQGEVTFATRKITWFMRPKNLTRIVINMMSN